MGKGVSAQEKKDRMVAMFHRECAVYTSKEVSKAASKEGIVAGAIEAVLKECVGDDLVREAKISGQLFYWSFPGEAASRKRAELAAARALADQQAQQIASLQKQEAQLRKEKGQSEEEAEALRQQDTLLAQAREAKAKHDTEAEQLRKQSAQNMHVRKKDLATLRDAANRWTDNAFMIRKHCIEKCGMDAAGADHMLGTNQMDYVE